MTKLYTIWVCSTFTGKTCYRILTNGCLESRDGAGKSIYTSQERTEAQIKKLNTLND